MITHYPLCSNKSQEWIDVADPSAEEVAQLGLDFELHPAYLQDLLQPEHLPKWEYNEERQLYFIIGRYHDEGARNAESLQKLTNKLAIFYSEGRLITVHRAVCPFLEELKLRATDPTSPFKTLFQLECKIFKELFRSFEATTLHLSDELEFYEGRVFSNRHLPPFIRGLFHLRRHIAVLKKVFLLSRTLLDCLRQQDGTAPQVQDTRDMFLRQETLADDLHDRSNALISIHLALSDQRSNEVMRVLTIFSAFFLPVTFIAGIYGMNFDNMPELRHPYGYFACLGVMAAVSATIFAWFKRKGWL